MSKVQGNRVPGRWAARRIRREGQAVARIYHHRVRDGQRVVWTEDDGRLKALVDHDRAARRETIAYRMLAREVGHLRAVRLCERFAAVLATFEPDWSWPAVRVREWADWVESQGRSDGD